MSIIIDKEFESLIPPLTADEFRQLEENILHDGIRDPLVVWPQENGDNILIDGHNRFEISAKHSGVQFKILSKEFKDRDAAKRWIILNQFGRRNLSAYDRSILALKLKPLIAEKAKERMINAPQKKAERKKAIAKIWQEHDFDTARVLVAQKKQEFGRKDRAEKMAGEKCIYFARFGDNQLKIGSSVNPEDRVKQLSVSCPGIKLVEVIHYGAGAEKHENAIKRKYGQYRIGNECYQCSDEILSKMIAFTKKEAARKNNTDYELAKVAGVSHDTIHKVETIDKQADQETKQLIREGKLSINQAYNSLRPKQQDPVKQAKQEHEEFQTKKSDGIVNFKDLQIDKINQDIIGNSLLQEVLKLINEVDKFAMIHKTEELKTLTTAVKDDERGIIADKCKTGRMTLQIIENYIRGI